MSAARSVRLDRLLANLGYGSRREIQGLVRAGAVRLDGADLGDAGDRIALDAGSAGAPDGRRRRARSAARPVPDAAQAAGRDLLAQGGGPLVYELLPERWRRREPPLSTVGRLDKETSGLLLLTDDGALLHRIIRPKAQVAKRYRVTLDRPLAGSEAAVFASGTLMLEGEARPLLPVRLDVEDRHALRA